MAQRRAENAPEAEGEVMNLSQSLKGLGLVAILVAVQSWGGDLPDAKSTNAVGNTSATRAKKGTVTHVLRSGDRLTIRFDFPVGREEHSKTIDEDGNIEMPLVGKIKLAGLTTAEAMEAIRKTCAPWFNGSPVEVRLILRAEIFIGMEHISQMNDNRNRTNGVSKFSIHQPDLNQTPGLNERLGDHWLPGEFEKMLEEKKQEQKQKKE